MTIGEAEIGKRALRVREVNVEVTHAESDATHAAFEEGESEWELG